MPDDSVCNAIQKKTPI